jgi:hypothetical protein
MRCGGIDGDRLNIPGAFCGEGISTKSLNGLSGALAALELSARDGCTVHDRSSEPVHVGNQQPVAALISFETAFLSSGSRLVQAAWRAAR